MTSNTLPEGEVFASPPWTFGNYIYEPYKAFNGIIDDITDQGMSYVSIAISNFYIGYKFSNDVIVRKICVHNRSCNTSSTKQGIKDCVVQYADSLNGTWTNITSFVVKEETGISIPVGQFFNIKQINKGHKYWRILSTNNHGNPDVTAITELQFYGRFQK